MFLDLGIVDDEGFPAFWTFELEQYFHGDLLHDQMIVLSVGNLGSDT